MVAQPGFDRQQAPEAAPTDPTDTPIPNVVLREAKAHLRCQVLVVSLGTRALSQVLGSDATARMHREFFLEQRAHGATGRLILNLMRCRRRSGICPTRSWWTRSIADDSMENDSHVWV